jgi:ABC-type multidrug transport system fused ATPase/permease subunit
MGSLRRNLALGLRQRPSDAKLDEAARDAGLGALLDRAGHLDAVLAEGGRGLSTQERSALSLARILLGRPQLVLLGDGVRHLDPKARHILTAHLETTGATVLRHPALSQASGNGPLAA